jgi:hypothetical protein
MAYYLAHRRGIGDDGIDGKGTKVDQAVEGFACPLRWRFDLLLCAKAAMEPLSDVQYGAGGRDIRVERVGQNAAGTVLGETALGSAWCLGSGEPQGELDERCTHECVRHK